MGEDAGNTSLADVDGNGHPEATTLRAKTGKTPSSLPGAGSGERRLDDVSMDDDDNLDPSSGMGLHGNGSTSTASATSTTPATPAPIASTPASSTPLFMEVAPSTTLPTCTDTDGKVYVEGQRFSNACDEVCTCAGGMVTCTARCKAPFLRRGARVDPLCVEKDSDKDPCCVLLVCAQDSGEHKRRRRSPPRPRNCLPALPRPSMRTRRVGEASTAPGRAGRTGRAGQDDSRAGRGE